MIGCIIDEVEDGTLKINIPKLGITTYASDMEDAQSAILEGILLFHCQKYEYDLE